MALSDFFNLIAYEKVDINQIYIFYSVQKLGSCLGVTILK